MSIEIPCDRQGCDVGQVCEYCKRIMELDLWKAKTAVMVEEGDLHELLKHCEANNGTKLDPIWRWVECGIVTYLNSWLTWKICCDETI